ncbi:hypothetical protein [Cohnella sp. JJ-181]|uniref:hypothetical protein n=1 Tax=Cohnella rhizoplanae TaxID=2974897 RepID=UPI0022FF8029|nr:hypothetical protein [Cohnella sp. JJ-181]CAI6073650.1 hypothetical protein COHCIP112018_02394 [Cohnella sp. JJ-181]
MPETTHEWVPTSREGKQKEQIEHIPTIKASEDGADKETVRLWNLMVKTLKENGLMKDK